MSNVDNVRSVSELTKMNAFTNNTFSLPIIEKTLRSAVENSFNYLKKLQASYIDTKKFVRSEDDFYFDSKNNLCLSLDKDFIEVNKRKEYRLSKFYNTFIDLKTIQENRDLFSYTPVVLIDGESVFSFEVKSSLDGNTVLKFNHIKYMRHFLNSLHTVEILFLKNSEYHVFTTNKLELEASDWKINCGAEEIDSENSTSFVLFQPTTDRTGSNIYPITISENNIFIDASNDNIYDLFVNNDYVNIHIVTIKDMHRVPVNKDIHTRIDNGRLSSTFILPEESGGVSYNMPIPTKNIILLKMNKTTKEISYESNKDIVLHYPNIYEVMCDDLSTNYEFIVYYFYKETIETFEYHDTLKFIYRYLNRKLSSNSLEESINKVLYDTLENKELQEFILNILNYKDAEYIYSHGDFFATHVPYTLDYKIAKMKEFIVHDPDILQSYAENVGTPNERYYVKTKNIDLTKRIRRDTSREVINKSDIHTFDEDRYLFMFANESCNELNLRIFIDGLICQDAIQIQVKDMDCIYIPTSEITEDSYIEVENFGSYQYRKQIVFESTDKYLDVEFTNANGNVPPTLFDLMFLDKMNNRIDRKKFRIFCLIDPPMYEVTDGIDESSKIESGYMTVDNNVYQDEETGEWFMDIDELIINNTDLYLDDPYQKDDDGNRMKLQYMFLKKLRLYCMDGHYTNTPIYIAVNKLPSIYTKKLKNIEIPYFRVNNGIPWNESTTYFRTYVNGRFVPFELMVDKKDVSDTYVEVEQLLTPDDVVTVDMTPYSYQLEYSIKTVPEDFVINIEGILSKPFSLEYYDVYLNGKKLTEMQIESITPQRIKLFNVHSRKNLYIYKKDRDLEYFGFEIFARVPLDDIFESPAFEESDIDDIIDDIIKQNHPDDIINEGDDTEPDSESNYDGDVRDKKYYQIYKFYVDYILSCGVVKPNEDSVSQYILKTKYNKVYDIYSNKLDRVVFRPNARYSADAVLMIGKHEEE